MEERFAPEALLLDSLWASLARPEHEGREGPGGDSSANLLLSFSRLVVLLLEQWHKSTLWSPWPAQTHLWKFKSADGPSHAIVSSGCAWDRNDLMIANYVKPMTFYGSHLLQVN